MLEEGKIGDYMSNENSTSNIPRRIRVGGNPSSGRSRKFSCITYLSEQQLLLSLMRHHNQIRACAYAYHDKDVREDGSLKEPHFHIVIVTYNTCTLSSVRRWFSSFCDSNGEITTTAQICSDVFSMFDYLTHNTKECREQNKYLYDSSIVQIIGEKDYFQCSEKSSYDNITLACEMLLSGKTIHDCGKIFGRDFILHYGAIKTYLTDVYMTEQGAGYEDINDVLKAEMFRKEILCK